MVGQFLDTFLDIWFDMAPWLLLGFVVAFLCSFFLSDQWMRRHLGGAGWLPIVKASICGLPLPICSCGVLLVGLALRKSGARKAPVCAFLASTPQSGADAVLISWPMLGPVFTLLRLVGAVLAGLLSGALVRWFGVAQPPPKETEDLDASCGALCACHHHEPDHPHHDGEAHHHEFVSRSIRLREAAYYAFVHLPGEVAGFLLIGVLLAAALEVFVPTGVLQGVSLPVAYLLAVIVGIPSYACSLAMIPVTVGLIAGGLTPGAAFVFLACAPTTHLGALLVLGRALGIRTVCCFVVGVVVVAVGMGLLIDFPLADVVCIPSATSTGEHAHSHLLGALLCLPLAGLLGYGVWRTGHLPWHSKH